MHTVPVRRPLRAQSPCPCCGSRRRVGYMYRGRWKGSPRLELCWRCIRSIEDALLAEHLDGQLHPVGFCLPRAAA